MEIGSEYNLELEALKFTEDNIVNYLSSFSTFYLSSARNALSLFYKYILHKDGLILLPEYICNSVISCFPKERIIFYKINKKLEVDLEDISTIIKNNKISVIYLMHYYGALQPSNVLFQLNKLKEIYNFLILEDTTHSIFTCPITIGDYAVASIRKWFPIPDGGIIYSKNLIDIKNNIMFPINTNVIKVYAMILKSLQLQGKINSKEIYRNMFEQAESLINKDNILLMSDFTSFLLKYFNIASLVKIRYNNFDYLKNSLSNLNISSVVDIKPKDCPFVFPIITENRNIMRKYLIENNIYCAVHWPLHNLLLRNRILPQYISNNIISLPIDQRYGINEMKYIENKLIDFIEGVSDANYSKQRFME